jgi:hypothetical protein
MIWFMIWYMIHYIWYDDYTWYMIHYTLYMIYDMILYMIWYVIWYIWYVIWYMWYVIRDDTWWCVVWYVMIRDVVIRDVICDMIYDIFYCNWIATRWQYSVHTQTIRGTSQIIHRTTQKYIEKHKNTSSNTKIRKSTGRAPGYHPGICLTTEEKHGKNLL